MARFSEEERPAFPDQDFFTTTVEKDIIALKSNSGRSPGPEMLIFLEVLPIGNVSSRDSWARRQDTDQAHRGESQSWVQPGPGSGDDSPERQKPLAFGSEEDGNVSRPVLNISLEASHDSVEAAVSPRLQVPQRLPIPCRAHGEGLVLRGAFGPSRRRLCDPAPRHSQPRSRPSTRTALN